MIRVQEEDFDIGAEVRALTEGNTQTGAVVTFTGLVREMNEGGAIGEMILEHYPGMTERELENLEREAREKWRLTGCLIIHRYGRLKPGDNIVLVITTSPHRREAFESAAWLMDFLKIRATFWKKEIGPSSDAWVESRQSDEDQTRRWAGNREQ